MGCCFSKPQTQSPLLSYEDIHTPVATYEKNQQEQYRPRYSFDGDPIEI